MLVTLLRLCVITGLLLCGITDRLASDRHEQLHKSSSDRFRVKLLQAGYDEDWVMGMDRPVLLEASAEVLFAEEQLVMAAQTPLPTDAISAGTSPRSDTTCLRELELEERRAEREMRRMELEAESRRAEREAEERRMEREATQVMERLRIEHELRLKELELRAPSGDDGENRFGDVGQVMRARHQDDSLAGRTKMYGNTMRHVWPKMPSQSTELPQFRPLRNCMQCMRFLAILGLNFLYHCLQHRLKPW